MEVRISARYSGPVCCAHCGGSRLRSKGRYVRQVRHENIGARHGVLKLEARKWQCLDCGRSFRQRFPGILPCQRSSEAFQAMIYRQHRDGINRSRLGRREGIGAATVERYFRHGLKRQFSEWHSPRCPRVRGIDEHFFTRKKGFATTLCDLHRHRVYDVVLGRSELSLESYFQRLEGKAQVRVVCMDLATHYRSLVRLHFPNARIVADRFRHNLRPDHHIIGVELLADCFDVLVELLLIQNLIQPPVKRMARAHWQRPGRRPQPLLPNPLFSSSHRHNVKTTSARQRSHSTR